MLLRGVLRLSGNRMPLQLFVLTEIIAQKHEISFELAERFAVRYPLNLLQSHLKRQGTSKNLFYEFVPAIDFP
jgi:hypothetical protein